MRYQHDYVETGRFLRTDPDLASACRGAAEDIMAAALILAPRDTNAYAASLSVEDAEVTDRVGAMVASDDLASAPLEFGNAKTRGIGRNVLERAAEVAGYDVGGA